MQLIKLCFVFLYLYIAKTSYSQSLGDYRSINQDSTEWTDASAWQIYTDSGWKTADSYPFKNNCPKRIFVESKITCNIEINCNTSTIHISTNNTLYLINKDLTLKSIVVNGNLFNNSSVGERTFESLKVENGFIYNNNPCEYKTDTLMLKNANIDGDFPSDFICKNHFEANGTNVFGSISLQTNKTAIIKDNLIINKIGGNKNFSGTTILKDLTWINNAGETFDFDTTYINNCNFHNYNEAKFKFNKNVFCSNVNIERQDEDYAPKITCRDTIFILENSETNIECANLEANSIIIDGILDFTGKLGKKNCNNILINDSGTFNNSGNEDLTVRKSFVNNGTCNLGKGKYLLSGTIKGNPLTFYKIVIKDSLSIFNSCTIKTSLEFSNQSVCYLNSPSFIFTLWKNESIILNDYNSGFVLNNNKIEILQVDSSEILKMPIFIDKKYTQIELTNKDKTSNFTFYSPVNYINQSNILENSKLPENKFCNLTFNIETDCKNANIKIYWHKDFEQENFNPNQAAIFHHNSICWESTSLSSKATEIENNISYVESTIDAFNPLSVGSYNIALYNKKIELSLNNNTLKWNNTLSNNSHKIYSSNDGYNFIFIDSVLPQTQSDFLFYNLNSSEKYFKVVQKTEESNVVSNTNKLKDSFIIYPNPASSQITITNENNSIKNILVFSKNSQKIDLEKTSNNTYSINELKSGMYFMKITTKQGNVITKRFVKK